jgi:hypothetical protein
MKKDNFKKDKIYNIVSMDKTFLNYYKLNKKDIINTAVEFEDIYKKQGGFIKDFGSLENNFNNCVLHLHSNYSMLVTDDLDFDPFFKRIYPNNIDTFKILEEARNYKFKKIQKKVKKEVNKLPFEHFESIAKHKFKGQFIYINCRNGAYPLGSLEIKEKSYPEKYEMLENENILTFSFSKNKKDRLTFFVGGMRSIGQTLT